jgi:7-cyano-7-deazaguanine synthase
VSSTQSQQNLESDQLLLLSGGIDSAALAAEIRPAAALFIDYGQRPAEAEERAASAISGFLDIPLQILAVDLRAIGAGLLLNEAPLAAAPSPEWWPFRNQLLVTLGAAVAMRMGLQEVVVGTVAGDGLRHRDGTQEFYESLNRLLQQQEGEISVITPAIHESTEELVRRTGVTEELLVWTVSCHRSSFPCGDCPGCWKRAAVMQALGYLQPSGPSQ